MSGSILDLESDIVKKVEDFRCSPDYALIHLRSGHVLEIGDCGVNAYVSEDDYQKGNLYGGIDFENRLHPKSIQDAMIYAARYAYIRATAAPYEIVRSLIAEWDRLSPETQKKIVFESEHALYHMDDWQRLRDYTKTKEEAK